MRQLTVLWGGFAAQTVRMLVIDRAILENVYLVVAEFTDRTLLEQLAAELQRKETRLDINAVKNLLDFGLETRPPEPCRGIPRRLAGDRQTDLRLGE